MSAFPPNPQVLKELWSLVRNIKMFAMAPNPPQGRNASRLIFCPNWYSLLLAPLCFHYKMEIIIPTVYGSCEDWVDKRKVLKRGHGYSTHINSHHYYFATIIICIRSCSGNKVIFRKGSTSSSSLLYFWGREQATASLYSMLSCEMKRTPTS